MFESRTVHVPNNGAVRVASVHVADALLHVREVEITYLEIGRASVRIGFECRVKGFECRAQVRIVDRVYGSEVEG